MPSFSSLRHLVSLVCLGALIVPATPRGVEAQQHPWRGSVRVVGNDSGGKLRPRIEEVRRHRARGDRVEIRGNYCLSSCTLFLGAGDVCVTPSTTFGFHGPGYLYEPIRYDRFDYWSRRMAAHYPPEISNWFMSTARFVTHGYLSMTGSELIRMGVPRCRS